MLSISHEQSGIGFQSVIAIPQAGSLCHMLLVLCYCLILGLAVLALATVLSQRTMANAQWLIGNTLILSCHKALGHHLVVFVFHFYFAICISIDGAQAQAQQQPFASKPFLSASRSIEAKLAAIEEDASKKLDAGMADTLSALRLALEFNPKGRQRFVLPRQSEASKLSVDRIKKLFDDKDGLAEFRRDLESMVDLIDEGVNSAESTGDRESGYRLRWLSAGLRSILPEAKLSRKNGWSHAGALETAPEARRGFSNHPKTGWPAGSYTLISTPHFEIASQSDNKAALEVATLCEQSFAIWKQVFFHVWANKTVAGPEYPELLERKFSVVLFRNQEAYKAKLRSIPDIGQSTGYYDPNQRLALFYWDGNKTPSTVVHELTHQFFYEASAKPVVLDTNRGSGFWGVEGVALYMESMSTRACGGGIVADVGGWDSPRLQSGRYRRLHDKYWVPWEEFHTADGNRIRGEDDIRAWYSQAAGLAHLWLDGTAEQRKAFSGYIDSVYANKEAPAMLGEWNDDKKLRDAYDRFLIAGPSESPVRPYFSNRRDAVLCRSRLTSQQLLDWPIELRTAPWLDLSFSQVDDELFVVAGVKVVPSWNVQRLNLESTKVTDQSMASIADSKNLTELDLSNCAITDLGVAAIKDHKSLKTLWLNQCDVTDASIDVLLSMPQLESVHLSKTQVSVQGWGRLLAAKPRLKAKSTAP